MLFTIMIDHEILMNMKYSHVQLRYIFRKKYFIQISTGHIQYHTYLTNYSHGSGFGVFGLGFVTADLNHILHGYFTDPWAIT